MIIVLTLVVARLLYMTQILKLLGMKESFSVKLKKLWIICFLVVTLKMITSVTLESYRLLVNHEELLRMRLFYLGYIEL